MFIRTGRDEAIAGKILLARLAFSLGGEVEVFDPEAIEKGFYRTTDLPLCVNVDVIEFVGLEIDAADPGFYRTGDGVHDHESRLEHRLVVFDRVEWAHHRVFLAFAVPGEDLHRDGTVEGLPDLRIAEAVVFE